MTSKPVVETKSDSSKSPVEPLFPKIHLKRQKIVLLVVDALRTDFVLPLKEDRGQDKGYEFAEKLTIMHELAKSEPHGAKLFRFIADPPTATTQRLGGLTTGSLPSFVEAFQNFSSDTQCSDNIIFQFLANRTNRNLHFMGDDTWIHLYPFIIEQTTGKVNGYHSFQLFDLHTVDTAIKDQLFPTLQSQNYDLIIAHFLGLDHCGHKFGPLHKECGLKLKEYNDVIQKVIDLIDEETNLIILGDHGMTDEGDHGGDTPREISTVLFTYTKRGKPNLLSNPNIKRLIETLKKKRQEVLHVEKFYEDLFDDSYISGTVPQLDFASTFSIFTDSPIPFGNLGTVIPDIFISQFESELEFYQWLLDAFRLNSHQIFRHFKSLDSYQKDFAFLKPSLLQADALCGDPSAIDDYEKAIISYFDFMIESSTHCRKIWAKYDYNKISIGLLLTAIGALIILFCCWKLSDVKFELQDIVPLAIFFVVQCIGKLTNSFIIFEDYISYFLSMSFIVYQLLLNRNHSTGLITAAIFSRCFRYFGACRVENKHCQAFTHRSTHPQSTNGALVLVFMAFCLFNGKKSKITLLLNLLTVVFQIFGWFSESFQIDEWLIQVLLPRLLLVSSACLLIFSIYMKRKSHFYISMLTLITAVQRPFSGWVIYNAGVQLLPKLLSYTASPLYLAISCYLFGLSLFFWSAHNAVISNIHWESAFFGFPELNQLRAGFFLILNTFGSQIITTIAAILIDPSVHYSTFFIYSCMLALELLVSSLSIRFLLQHLMLWTVFTPRFIMQAMVIVINFTLYLTLRYIIRFKVKSP